MVKIKVIIKQWNVKLYSAYADLGRASIDTNNYKTPQRARQSMIYTMQRLGVSKDRYEFVN